MHIVGAVLVQLKHLCSNWSDRLQVVDYRISDREMHFAVTQQDVPSPQRVRHIDNSVRMANFDHSGFVNAEYASPAEILGTTSVTERVYRGFPRTMSELQICLDIFRAQKTAINNLILNFNLLSSRTRKEANDYINEFYRIIEDKHDVEKIFIDNARKN